MKKVILPAISCALLLCGFDTPEGQETTKAEVEEVFEHSSEGGKEHSGCPSCQ